MSLRLSDTPPTSLPSPNRNDGLFSRFGHVRCTREAAQRRPINFVAQAGSAANWTLFLVTVLSYLGMQDTWEGSNSFTRMSTIHYQYQCGFSMSDSLTVNLHQQK